MKRLIRHIALAATLLLTACAENPTDELHEGGGAATFTIATPQTRAAAEEEPYPFNCCAIRIYKYTDEGSKELIRRYNKRSELPASLWLVAGNYSIAVEAGSKTEAGFGAEDKTYAGATDFEIVDGRTTMVEVVCRIVNTMVKVIYDPTVTAAFKESRTTDVVFGDPKNAKAPRLTYAESATGYFLLPEEPTTLHWTFRGKGTKNGELLELEKSGSRELTPKPGVLYELKLKYSKDLGGALDFTLTLDENPDEIDDPIVFVPNPQIAGEGFDLTQPQEYLTGMQSYRITSIADMAAIEIEAYGQHFTVPATGDYPEDGDGIALAYANSTEMVLTLGPQFFAHLPGGEHTLTLTALDADGGEGTKQMTVRMLQGARSLVATDCWNAKARLEALVYDPATARDAKIRYRKAGASEWRTAEAAPAEAGLYTAEALGIEAATEYEYQLLFGEEPVNGIACTRTAAGPQIPNSDFEQWSGSSPLLPYLSGDAQWWDTGNHGSSTLNVNVTNNVNDPRPGSAGRTAAKLQSQKVAMLGIGKFAAGNLFVGKYLKTDKTDGELAFGKYFDFTYRPRALRFWYKGSVGAINECGGNTPSEIQSGQSDISTVYLCLCTMGDEKSSHVTRTKDVNSFFNPRDRKVAYSSDFANSNTNDGMGDVIAHAIWECDNSQQHPGWTLIEVPVTYYPEHEGTKPTHLLLIASASKYGDYFTGSTQSVMYLDDLELVY